jgi:hypothetical protein
MHIINQKMWFEPRMSLLGVTTQKFSFRAVMPPKTPSFRDRNRDFRLKCRVEQLTVRFDRFQSSIAQTMQLRERNSGLSAKMLKFAFCGVIDKNSPKGIFQPKYSIA